MLRPHGHLLRSGHERCCPTSRASARPPGWTARSAPSSPRVTSPRRDHVGAPQLPRASTRAHGLRFFVGRDVDGRLAAARHPVGLVRSALGRVPVVVRPTTGWRRRLAPGDHAPFRPDRDECDRDVKVLDGPPVELLAAAHVPWLDLDGPIGSVTPEADGLRIAPPADSDTAGLFPSGSVHLGWTPGSGDARRTTSVLFLDGRSRGLPWVTFRTDARQRMAAHARRPTWSTPDPTRRTDPSFWEPWPAPSRSSAPDTSAGRELDRIATALPWFAHDALIHYLSPRGLEQYSGGAWGSRDVTQGPVGLLLTLGAHAELREPGAVDHAGPERPRRLAAGLRLPPAASVGPVSPSRTATSCTGRCWRSAPTSRTTGDQTILAEQRALRTGDDGADRAGSGRRPRPGRSRPDRVAR